MPRYVDWGQSADQAAELTLNKKDAIVKKRPGFEFYPDSYYVGVYGDIDTNGKLALGRRRWQMDGQSDVLVPDKLTTNILTRR